MQAAVALIGDAERAATLLEPTRLRVLEELREPGSAAGVARALGLPRQRVSYHVRELEKRGLVRRVGERRRRNCVERVVQASARRYLIAPQALGALGVTAESVRDRLSSSYLVALAAQTIRDVASLRERADAAGKRLPTLTLQAEVRFASPAQQAAFAEELAARLAELAAKYHAGDGGGGRSFRFAVLGHAMPATVDAGGEDHPARGGEER